MTETLDPSVWDIQQWPPDVRMVLSVLEDLSYFGKDRRQIPRTKYQVRATLELPGENPLIRPRTVSLYTHDASTGAIGFLTDQLLPVGSSATLYLPSPSDRVWRIPCLVLRCASFVDHWYEGAVLFVQEQPAFNAEAINFEMSLRAGEQPSMEC